MPTCTLILLFFQVFFIALVVLTCIGYTLYGVISDRLYRIYVQNQTERYSQLETRTWPNAASAWFEEQSSDNATMGTRAAATGIIGKTTLTNRETTYIFKKNFNSSFMLHPNESDKNIENTESLAVLQEVKRKNTNSPLPSHGTCDGRSLLVFLCVKSQQCGGWGDRQKGIISTFLLALLTNRTFVIVCTNPCQLSKFLQPNKYNWTICNEYAMSLPKSETEIVNLVDRAGNFSHSLRTESLQNLFQYRVVFIRTNRIWNKEILDRPEAAQRIPWAVGKSTAEVSRMVLEIMFKPGEELAFKIEQFMNSHAKNKQLACSHLRVGKNPSIPTDARRRFGAPNVSSIFEFLRKFDKSSNYTIYVATDSAAVRRRAKESFTHVATVDMPVVHIDRYTKAQDGLVACTGLFTVLLEQYILSKCDVLLLTHSNLGTMAAYMSNKLQDLFIFYRKNRTIVHVDRDALQEYFKYI